MPIAERDFRSARRARQRRSSASGMQTLKDLFPHLEKGKRSHADPAYGKIAGFRTQGVLYFRGVDPRKRLARIPNRCVRLSLTIPVSHVLHFTSSTHGVRCTCLEGRSVLNLLGSKVKQEITLSAVSRSWTTTCNWYAWNRVPQTAGRPRMSSSRDCRAIHPNRQTGSPSKKHRLDCKGIFSQSRYGAEVWGRRIRWLLAKSRLPGSYFSAERERLRQLARHPNPIGIHLSCTRTCEPFARSERPAHLQPRNTYSVGHIEHAGSIRRAVTRRKSWGCLVFSDYVEVAGYLALDQKDSQELKCENGGTTREDC